MIKKALIKTCIWEFMDENSINTTEELGKSIPELYEYLKNHKHHKNLIPIDMTLEIFSMTARNGFNIAVFKYQMGIL